MVLQPILTTFLAQPVLVEQFLPKLISSVGADLAIFSYVKFNGTLDFNEAKLKEAHFNHSYVSKVTFRDTRFEDVTFEETNLNLAYFNKTIFTKAQFTNSNITEAEFIDIKLIQIEKFVPDKDLYHVNKMAKNTGKLLAILNDNTNFET